jgi:serine/threonine-protein kinase RIO1
MQEPSVSVADLAAGTISRRRTNGFTYDRSAPEEERRKKRAELRAWLQEQFRRVASGEKPGMRAPQPITPAEFRIDAP